MKRWVTILKVLIGLTLFIGLIWFIDPVKIWADVREIGRFHLLLYGVLFFLIGLVPVQSLKFYFLLKSGRSDASFMDALRIVMIGFLFNNFLPTNVGGDVMKSYLFKRSSSLTWGRIVGLVTLERVVGLVILLVYGALFLLFKGEGFYERLYALEWNLPGSGTWLFYGAGILIILSIGAFFFFPERVRSLIAKLRDLLLDSWKGVLELGAIKASGLAFFSLLFHACRVTGYVFFLFALGQAVHFTDLAFAVVFTSLVSLIPVSVGALGVKEGGLALALSIFGVPFDIGVTAGILNRGMLFLVSLIGLGYYFSSGDRYVLKESMDSASDDPEH